MDRSGGGAAVNVAQTAALLGMYRADATLLALLAGGTAAANIKVSYAILPPTYPSVNIWVEDDRGDPRTGFLGTGAVDHSVSMSIHIYSHDEGVTVGATDYDAVSIQAAIADRVGVISRNMEKNAGVAAVLFGLRDILFEAKPLPFEEETHVHHTLCLLTFGYVSRDSL
jgi:hypothetical protein